jgi:hypothetical protein
LKRFPTLQTELAAACYKALERFREDGRKTTLRLVDMESAYLTVEFFRKLPQEVDKTGTGNPRTANPPAPGNPRTANPPAPSDDRYSDAHFRRIASNVSSYIGMVSETLKNTIPKSVVHCQVREAKRSLLNDFYTQVGGKDVSNLLCVLACSFLLPIFPVNKFCFLQAKQLAVLLDEDPALMERRLQCFKRLELYKSARDEIDSVSWTR